MKNKINVFDKFKDKEYTSPVAMLLEFRSDDDFVKFIELGKENIVKNTWNSLCNVKNLFKNIKENFNEICFYLYFIHRLDREFIGNYDLFILSMYKENEEEKNKEEFLWILYFLKTANYYD